MPNDNLVFPRRFIGYGAYNLCFDKTLGAWPDKDENGQPVTRNFFQYLRARPQFNAINLVKVIVFRTSTIEGLPPVAYDANGAPKSTSRTQPLYRKDGVVNVHFMANLLNLVRVAKEHGFWVQVCIFHEHAIKAYSDGTFENPENAPPVLNMTKASLTNCQRLSAFFNINESTQEGRDRLAAQRALVGGIATHLRMETNVLFEIGNELRIQGCDAENNILRNCAMVPWLQTMADAILSAIFWDNDPSGTSTGSTNERHVFATSRPAACGATSPRWRPHYFDFHSGQWGIGATDLTSDDYILGIPAAKSRAVAYGSSFLIINDDGTNLGEELAPGEKEAHAKLIKEWARVAFRERLHYSSKQQYPPVGWDIPALRALAEANALEPLT